MSPLRYLVGLLAHDTINPPLAAGEIVTTGTLTRAIPVKSGGTWGLRSTASRWMASGCDWSSGRKRRAFIQRANATAGFSNDPFCGLEVFWAYEIAKAEYYATICANVFASEEHKGNFCYSYQSTSHNQDVNNLSDRNRSSLEDPFYSEIDSIIQRRQGHRPGAIPLRGSSHGAPLRELNNAEIRELSWAFARNTAHRPLIERLRQKNRGLFEVLASADRVPFNPMRDL